MRICPRKAVVSETPAPTPRRGLFSVFGRGSEPAWTVDPAKCTGCLLCAQYCPHGAVSGRERTPS